MDAELHAAGGADELLYPTGSLKPKMIFIVDDGSLASANEPSQTSKRKRMPRVWSQGC